MESSESQPSPFEFLKKISESKFAFVFYLIPVILINALLYLVAGCYFVLLVPLSALLIPYYMGLRGVRKFALFGVFVLIINPFIFGTISTHRAYDYENYWGSFEGWKEHVKPQSSEDGALSDGVFSPRTGGSNTEFTFNVVYTDVANETPDYVHVVVSDDLIAGSGNELVFNMNKTDPSDIDYSDGVEYWVTTTLPSGIEVAFPEFPNHFHYFESDSASYGYSSTAFTTDDTTSYALGPMNASLGDVYWLNIIWAFYNMLFVIVMFYLGVGMYWWLSQARTRATQWQERAEEMKREEWAEFECDRCGADVPEDAEKCPRCGAVFDEEEATEEEPTDEEDAEFECDNCGADVPGDAKKCPNCGEPFDE